MSDVLGIKLISPGEIFKIDWRSDRSNMASGIVTPTAKGGCLDPVINYLIKLRL